MSNITPTQHDKLTARTLSWTLSRNETPGSATYCPLPFARSALLSVSSPAVRLHHLFRSFHSISNLRETRIAGQARHIVLSLRAHFFAFSLAMAARSFSATASSFSFFFFSACFSSKRFCASFCSFSRSSFSSLLTDMPFFACRWLRRNLLSMPLVVIFLNFFALWIPFRCAFRIWLQFVWFLDLAIATTRGVLFS